MILHKKEVIFLFLYKIAKKEYNLDVDLNAFNPEEEIFKPFS